MHGAKVSLLWIGFGTCVGFGAACNAITGVYSIPFANGSGGGVGGTSSGVSSTGGPECQSDGDCTNPIPPGPCASRGMRACVSGKCGVSYTSGPAPSQVYGSCQQNKCDGSGTMTTVADDTNVFDSGNECVQWVCNQGVLSHHDLSGTSCATASQPAGFCEQSPDPSSSKDAYSCEACDPIMMTGCTGPLSVCVSGHCVAPHCTNTTKDGGETDLNCGGNECLPCTMGKSCGASKDCFSLVCSGSPKTCQLPSCSDGQLNQDETATDCGGAHCMACPDWSTCTQPSDCLSGVCGPPASGMLPVCQPPSCTDGIKNGGETGIDCGGSDDDGGTQCPPCAM
jgi:hypothetical protein